MPQTLPPRPRGTLLAILLAWVALYGSWTLFAPALLDDADSVHAEVAREMLLRHDYVTLYANGIRYLEKAPFLYWCMALMLKFGQVIGATSARAMAAEVRFPIALMVLVLAFFVEAFARKLYGCARAGLYAALIVLSSAGVFLFSRLTLPDTDVCAWLTLAMLAYFATEGEDKPGHWPAAVFGVACALGVLSKGLIGLVFPVAIVLVHLLVTRGVRRGWARLRELRVGWALMVFLVIAAPWHVLAGLANPGSGHPASFHFVAGHWQVPLPSDGNVRGWFWFYFMNEHVLRYMSLRVPRDYDTSPLWLFWGLCFVWVMPWSAFVFKAYAGAVRWKDAVWRSQFRRHDLPLKERGQMLLVVWTAVVLGFFTLSTRQEYYVLPALPAMAMVIAGWLEYQGVDKAAVTKHRKAWRHCVTFLFLAGTIFTVGTLFFFKHTAAAVPGADLAQLLQQNPGDYALSLGHFLDLNANALSLFCVPLTIAALSLFGGPAIGLLLHKGPDSVHPVRLFLSILTAKTSPRLYKTWAGRSRRYNAANIALAVGAFGFLVAVHLGLQTFSPVISSEQLAQAIKPLVKPGDMVAIHGEYEAGSTLGFYLQRNDIHILEGRSSNLWYGSFFPDAPKIFETPESIRAKWNGPQRIFLWQSVTDSDAPMDMPKLDGPVYVVARSGGKEILSNRQ